MKFSLLILSGGKSSRMEYHDKACLKVDGRKFLELIYQELASHMEEVIISEGHDLHRQYPDEWKNIKIVEDSYRNCGPLGGIHAGLLAAEQEYVCIVGCDMPKIRYGLFSYLSGFMTEDCDIVVPAVDGRRHPLAGIYRKGILDVVEEQLESEKYSLWRMMDRVRVCEVDLTGQTDYEQMLVNINTTEEYEKLSGHGYEAMP